MYEFNTFFTPYAPFFHVLGAKSTKIGNTSNLPTNISNIKTIFDHHEKPANDPLGPTSPSPGPILLIVAVTAVKFVVTSLPSKEMSKRESTKINAYAMKNAATERTTSAPTGCLSMEIFFTSLG